MADNVTAPAIGAVLATDDIASVHYPITKLSFGALGTATPVSAADPMPVGDALALAQLQAVVAALGGTITVDGSVALDASTLAALESITVGGTVDLGATSLAALESITVAFASAPAVSVTGNQVTLTNQSGTAGVVAANAIAANASRRGWSIQNLGPGVLWFNTLAAAVADSPSFQLDIGDYYETPAHAVSLGAVSVIASLASTKFTAREW